MSLFGYDVNNLLPLLPQPSANGLKRKGFASAGGAAHPGIAVGVLVIVVKVQKHRRAVVHVETEKNAALVAELVRGKGEGRRDAAGQGVSPGLPLNIRVQRQQGQHGQKALLVFVVAAPGNHIDGHAELFHRRHPLFQRFGIFGRYLNEGMHIVEILTLTVHDVLEV
ncbi:hypothetical protein SDC9_153929 [bioreactor metagenome]|uniref:Uncharacterized protein n=1 Tax=bioreactor metagenome TaxID=1076179 RepID=A0A645F1Y9_9ZZZZ